MTLDHGQTTRVQVSRLVVVALGGDGVAALALRTRVQKLATTIQKTTNEGKNLKNLNSNQQL